MNSLYSTLLHIGELAVILALIWAIKYFFPDLLPSESLRDAILVVLAGLVKFARASESVPIEDYVNKKV
jgi:hypothetical protein